MSEEFYNNSFETNPTRTTNWEGAFGVNPEDRSLAVTVTPIGDVNATPDRFLELWYRFQVNNLDTEIGDKCLFCSYTLKKIMRIHGFPAKVQQVVVEYRHAHRKWAFISGRSDANTPGLTTHAVVECNNWILDFAQMPIYNNFGAMAPKAIIAQAVYDQWQDLGFFGQVKYVKKSMDHPETKNQRVLDRSIIANLVRSYFSVFRV